MATVFFQIRDKEVLFTKLVSKQKHTSIKNVFEFDINYYWKLSVLVKYLITFSALPN